MFWKATLPILVLFKFTVLYYVKYTDIFVGTFDLKRGKLNLVGSWPNGNLYDNDIRREYVYR